MLSKEKKDKVTIWRMVKNVGYVVNYACKVDRKLVYFVWSVFTFNGLVNALFNTLFIKYLIEMLQDETKSLTSTITFVCAGIMVLAVSQVVQVFMENKAEADLVHAIGVIQKDFIHKVADMDFVCYDKTEYYNDFILAASQSEEMMTNGIMAIARMLESTVSILAMGSLIVAINPAIAIFPILGFFFNIVTRFKIERYEFEYALTKKRIMRKADYSKRVFYQPEYAKEIRLYDVEAPLRMQFNEAIEEAVKEAKQYGRKICIYSLINWIIVFTFLSYWCIPIYLGYYAIVKLSIALGDVAALNNAANKVRGRLDALNYALVDFQKVGQYAECFRRFLEYDIKVENAEGSMPVPEEQGVLSIKNMSFRYEGADKDTLHDINMTVQPGEKIAIVGGNGAGKSTFIKLLVRLYDATEGSIEYGGNDIRKYATRDYRKLFGIIFQDYQIYATSLAENVLMDEYDKTKKGQIEKALVLADFEKKLKKLKKGVETEMTKEFSEEGTLLSGGESQKVAIARLFLKKEKTKIAILDEPSSALDPKAEYKLNKNTLEKIEDATVIFISHRLSTTKDADRIYMFADGTIVEQGTHEELMKLDGRYADMFKHQAYYYQDEIGEM